LNALWPFAFSVKAGQRVFAEIRDACDLRFAKNGVVRQIRWDQRNFDVLTGHKLLMRNGAGIRDA
jgi:hypothetical protein